MTLRSSGFLQDILISARLAISYLENIALHAFAKDIQLQDSVVRRPEIIGEAVSHIAEEASIEMPELPWRKMVDMRNHPSVLGCRCEYCLGNSKQDLPAAVATIERYLTG